MGSLRVRWSSVARWAGGALVVLVAAQALPAMLRPPDPPPLAADIGLPRPAPARPGPDSTATAPVARISPGRPLRPRRSRHGGPGRKRADRRAGAPPPPAPSGEATPAPVPPSPPSPPPAPRPAPPPPPPGDGSVEFSPH